MKNLTELQNVLLRNRNVKDDELISFLEPNYNTELYDPFLLQDMQIAVDRILLAIERNEKIVIYSDYDCDGIPGAVVLHDFFNKIEYKNFINYIPHRHNEGYGIHISALDNLSKEGVSLLISVDLGITNIKEVEYAKSIGIDCIITDHHLPHTEVIEGVSLQILPPALAVINAKRTGNVYPDDMLCGCATSWKLVCALIKVGKEKEIEGFVVIVDGWEKWLLDMVAISTICDMVPLQKENRLLAIYGMKVLRKSKRPGLLELLKNAGVNQSDITEEDIAFSIGPRINAASRMDIPMEAFTLFSTDDKEMAKEQAYKLEGFNNARKESVLHFMKKAYKLAETKKDNAIIVLGDLDFTPGVLGLIASKILDEYKKTVFVWGKGEGDVLKGSCRSDGYTHLVDLMSATDKGTFVHMGGHEMAGGFAVGYTAVHDLEQNILLAYEKIKHKPLEKKEDAKVDSDMTFDAVNLATYSEISALAPFGVANQKPLFKWSGQIKEVKLFGKTKNHLQLDFENKSGKTIKCIGFFMTNIIKKENGETVELEPGIYIELEGNIELSTFAGRREIRIRIINVII